MTTYIVNDNGIDREATADELAEIEQREKDAVQAEADRKAKEAARAAVLAKLGLTADEAAVLFG
jgi:hypothetical protein